MLRHIDVLHRGDLVSRYDLGYMQGAFGKTILATVGRAGSDGQVYGATTFNYFHDVRPDGTHYQGFAPTQTWNTGTDSLTDDVRGPQPVSALGGSTETDGGAHAYLGFNPTDPLKDGSFGGSFGFKIGASEAKAEFIAMRPSNAHPHWWRQRLGIVRGFTRDLNTIDPLNEVPPKDLLPVHRSRITPYLSSPSHPNASTGRSSRSSPAMRSKRCLPARTDLAGSAGGTMRSCSSRSRRACDSLS